MTDRAGEQLRVARRALNRLGAEVRVFAGADNCVRRREPGEAAADASDDPERLPFVIEVEGVPNLLHELAHVVLLGRVEKDHATEYARIPFDLTTPGGRRLVFEELACCIASCVWYPGDDRAAQAWFEEQVGIQGVFFGFESDFARFLAETDVQVRMHREELYAVIARAVNGIGRLLATPATGGAPRDAEAQRAFPFAAAWRRLLAANASRR